VALVLRGRLAALHLLQAARQSHQK
jgi:hypothetical protein